MARLNIQTSSSDAESDQDASLAHTSRPVTSETSASPALSFSSDKENRGQSNDSRSGGAKRKPASSRMATSSATASASSNKKRKLGQALPSQAVHRKELEERVDKQYYDPDQNEEERRATRKGMRELAKELNGKSLRWLHAKMETNLVQTHGQNTFSRTLRALYRHSLRQTNTTRT